MPSFLGWRTRTALSDSPFQHLHSIQNVSASLWPFDILARGSSFFDDKVNAFIFQHYHAPNMIVRMTWELATIVGL